MAGEKRVQECSDAALEQNILLLDIEGTTTSIDFVKDTLFPYVRDNLKKYVDDKWEDEEFKAVLEKLKEQAKKDEEDKISGVVLITGSSPDEQKESLVKNILWQMDNDRKTGALKQLQGYIWREAYKSGAVKGHIYDDVKEAIESWTSHGKKIYIYSSGSVEAQKLLFGYSKKGDLLQYFSGYFDTEVGPKQEATSYKNIVTKIGVEPTSVLFLTDIVKEAEAAIEAGLKSVLVVREGNAALSEEDQIKYTTIKSFLDLTFKTPAKRQKLDDAPKESEKKLENGNGSVKDIASTVEPMETEDSPVVESKNEKPPVETDESLKVEKMIEDPVGVDVEVKPTSAEKTVEESVKSPVKEVTSVQKEKAASDESGEVNVAEVSAVQEKSEVQNKDKNSEAKEPLSESTVETEKVDEKTKETVKQNEVEEKVTSKENESEEKVVPKATEVEQESVTKAMEVEEKPVPKVSEVEENNTIEVEEKPAVKVNEVEENVTTQVNKLEEKEIESETKSKVVKANEEINTKTETVVEKVKEVPKVEEKEEKKEDKQEEKKETTVETVTTNGDIKMAEEKPMEPAVEKVEKKEVETSKMDVEEAVVDEQSKAVSDAKKGDVEVTTESKEEKVEGVKMETKPEDEKEEVKMDEKEEEKKLNGSADQALVDAKVESKGQEENKPQRNGVENEAEQTEKTTNEQNGETQQSSEEAIKVKKVVEAASAEGATESENVVTPVAVAATS